MGQLSQLAPRPDRGGQIGDRCTVKANIFPVQVTKDIAISQYSVTIDPLNEKAFPVRENTTDKKARIPVEVSLAAFRQVELLIKRANPKAWCVFNGEAIAYSTASLDDVDFEVIAQKPDPFEGYDANQHDNRGGGGYNSRDNYGGGGRGGGAPVNAPTRSLKPAVLLTEQTAVGSFERLKVSIRKVKDLSLHGLLMVAKGQASEDSSTLETSNALSVLLRYVPSLLYVSHKSEFFSPVSRTSISGGLEIWRGYHQSLRALMAGHLGVNVDIASAIFRKGGMTVIDYLMDVASLRSPDDIARMSPKELTKHLKSVSVVTTHRGDQKQRFKISGVSSTTASNEFFDMNGQHVSVADYFQKTYKMSLKYPNFPLVSKASRGTKFPMEVLSIVPSQRMAGRLNGQQTADMIKATCQKPDARLRQIENGVRETLKYDTNEYLKEFGIKVQSEMMTIDARVLPAPKLDFARSSIQGAGGVWNLRDHQVVDSPLLESCAFIFFAHTQLSEAQRVRERVLEKWAKAGMNIGNVKDCPVLITNPGVFTNIRGGIQHAFREATEMFRKRCQLIVCVMEKESKRGQYYKEIKRVCLCEAGVASQVMLSKNVLPANMIKDQYIANVALKANIKLGGASNYVSGSLTRKSAMFVGLEVSHPPPGAFGKPSICAMVSSSDDACTKFNTYIQHQSRRVAVIVGTGEMLKKAVSDYKRANQGRTPSQIFVFRGGVSQGQFLYIKSEEIQSMSDALKEMNCNAELVVLVVQRQHHLRLFPLSGRHTDRSGNCVPGTVIDTQITHPYEFNFVLQSHAGIQGMSRPTVYHVLHNEAKMGSDELQQICFNICFLSERATRSIGVVAPSYRASLAATYARMFIEGDDDCSETASLISGGGESSVSTILRVADGVENMMYYM